MEARDGWIIDRARGNWEERHKVEMPSKGAFVGSLLGFGGSRAARRREKDQ